MIQIYILLVLLLFFSCAIACITELKLHSFLKVSMLEGKLSNYSIKNGEMEKRISTLSKKEEELVLTDKLLNDVNQDLKG